MENSTRSGAGKGCIVGAIVTAGVFLALLLLVFFSVGKLLSSGMEAVGGDKIAQIDVEGVISGFADMGFGGTGQSMVDRIREELKQAVENDSVKAIVLRINSPGGEVTASDTIYELVRQAKEKKPVVVYMDSIAASGGYYISAAATEIVANQTTLTGSIGVIIQGLNYKDLFDKVGLEATTFKSGKFKDILSGTREMSPEEEALVQGLVDEMYARFLEVVSEGRGIEESVLRNGIADGRVFSGTRAVELGLVDSTGYIEDAYARARELGSSPDAQVIKLSHPAGLLDMLFGAESRAKQAGPMVPDRIELDISERLMPHLQPGVMYYLPSFYAP